jgi:CHAP domain-containing protein
MSIETTLARVGAIRQAISDPAALLSSRSALSGGVEAPASTATASAAAATVGAAIAGVAPVGAAPVGGSFATALSQASAGSGAGARMVAVAESQLGQSEQPPGSNESPAIAEYRSATAGATPGEPWCAYFASWAARQAGEPLGAAGQGLGSVSEIWSWAQSVGRAVPNAPGVLPKPGDLIVFGNEHVGIVRGVTASGQIETIEGNYESKVAANTRSAGEASGYVSMS